MIGTSIKEYFYFPLKRIKLSENSEHYLVNLLGNAPPDLLGQEPLALMYRDATDSPANEQLPLFRTIGDKTLFISSFYPTYISKSLVTEEYYSTFGVMGYSMASELAKQQRDRRLHFVFSEISSKFKNIVQILRPYAPK